MTSQNYEYIDSHVLGSCPASFVARGKRNNEKDFHLTEVLIIALVCCVSQISQEHHWVFWCVVPWKFRADKGAWSPKLDYGNGPYLQNVLKSCRTSQNTAETRDARNTHTIPHPFQIMSFTFITSEGSPFSPVPGISTVPLTSASENFRTTWNTYHPKKVQVLLWCTKS